jgi:peptide/nickel transport system substrate-binding protein
MKRFFLVTYILLFFAAFLSAGARRGETRDGNTVLPARLTNREELIIAMDPRKIAGPYDPCLGWGYTGITLFQSKLMQINSQNELVGDLAENYTVSADGLTWTFTIRKDVVFHDGTKLGAEDVAFTYNKAKELASGVDLVRMNRAEARGDSTVIFHLNVPDSTFLYLTAIVGIVPRASYTSAYGDSPVGSGPFRFISYTQGQQLVIARNDAYYGKKSPFAKITILLMLPDAAFAAALAGAVDVATISEILAPNPPRDYRLESLNTYGYRVISMPAIPLGKEKINGIDIGNNVTADPVIRQALNIGISRQEIIAGALNGIGSAELDMFNKLPWGMDPYLVGLGDNRVEEAAALLDKAGWLKDADGIRAKGGVKAAFTLMYPPSDSGRQAIAEAFVQQAARLGIRVTLRGIELDDMRKDALNKRHPVVLGGGDYNPLKEYNMFSSGAVHSLGWNNIACYSNPLVDEYMEKAIRSTDAGEANKNWRNALWDGSSGAGFLGDVPYICVGLIRHNYFVRNGLDIGVQKIHPHDHNISILFNLNEWDLGR